MARIQFFALICLYFLPILNGKPRLLQEKSGKQFHFTSIGDLSSRDMFQLADDISPNTESFVPEQVEDPYDSNIEAETDEFSKTMPLSDDLASPRDEERTFVELLKKQYKGPFPEYGKETVADFNKNKELDENLGVQPETVYFDHSNKFSEKDINDENDYPVPDEVGQDNLDTFDEDVNILNKEKMKALETTSNVGVNNDNDVHKHRPGHVTQHKTQNHRVNNDEEDDFGMSNDDMGHSSTTEDNDDTSDKNEGLNHVSDHMTDSDNHSSDELKDEMNETEDVNHVTDTENNEDDDEETLKMKSAEKELFDIEEKLNKDKVKKKEKSRLHIQEKLNKDKVKKKEKSQQHNFIEILKDFDKLKTKQDKVSGNNLQTTNKSNKNYDESEEQNVKSIDNDHQSQGNGEAILDFLDKLLEKDPKKLKHDILAMTKEMQNEDNLKIATSDEAVISHFTNMKNKPIKTKEDEVDVWMSPAENDIENVKQEQYDNNETTEDFDDEEFDEFHNGQVSQDSNDNEEAQPKLKEDTFDYEEFKEEALKMHNEYRNRHNADALTWSESLAKKAKEIAEKLVKATRSHFKDELQKRGENIAIIPYSVRNIAKHAVEKWYEEIVKFSFNKPSLQPETRDFTQIIWKHSKELGMGFAHTKDRKNTLVVALYTPEGNDKSKLAENFNSIHDDPYADIKRNVFMKHSIK